MQLSPAQLLHHLARGLEPLYPLHGDEPLLIQEAADAIRAAARAQGFTERSVHTALGAGFDWSEVLAAGGSMSLFAAKQIVEVRIPTGKPGKEGGAALQQLAQQARGRLGSPSGCARRASASKPARPGSARCSSSRTRSRAICSPRTRKSANSRCCTRRASCRSSRSSVRC